MIKVNLTDSIENESVENFLNNLNTQQRLCVFSEEKKICVVAGPGCGKTRTLVSRICRIIREEKKMSILVLTFGKKAINEIKERVKKLVIDYPENLKISNIHSFCFEFLQRYYSMLDFAKENSFNICDGDLQKSIFKQIIEKNDDINFDEKNIFQIIKEISLKKINVISNLKKETENIFFEYEKFLRQENCLDFSDLLIYTLELLKKNESLKKFYQDKFSHILVDEFQDINKIQWEIINCLKKENFNSLFVVGDPNQCIYSFQGSDPKIMEFFKKDNSWKTYYLNINYRSGRDINKLSNSFLIENKSLAQNFLQSVKNENGLVEYKKDFSTGEIVEIVKKLVKNNECSLNEIAIIYRSNYLSAWLEKELLEKEIPYEILGAYKFLQRSEVKDLIAYLRIIVSSENISTLRVLSLIRGIGKKTINLIENESYYSNLKIIDFLNFHFESLNSEKKETLNQKIANSKKILLINFVKSLSEVKRHFESNESLFFSMQLVLEKFDYVNYLEERFGEEKLMNVKQLMNIIKKWDEESNSKDLRNSLEKAKEFLNYIFMSFSDEDENKKFGPQVQRLIISNVHQVKGLEFKAVLFAYLDEGIIPSSISDPNKEEEKRIFYVGITRAKEFLYLVSMNRPSRFLNSLQNN